MQVLANATRFVTTGVKGVIDTIFPHRPVVQQVVEEIIQDGTWARRHERLDRQRVIDINAIIKTRLISLLPA